MIGNNIRSSPNVRSEAYNNYYKGYAISQETTNTLNILTYGKMNMYEKANTSGFFPPKKTLTFFKKKKRSYKL